MIKEFVEAWDKRKGEVEAQFKEAHPTDYLEVVTKVIEILSNSSDYDFPDTKRITMIDHGDYQGTLLFVIGADGCQPSKYWYVFVGYGSCSGCDTLQAIKYDDPSYGEGKPTDGQVAQYMTLALHIVQGLHEISAY